MPHQPSAMRSLGLLGGVALTSFVLGMLTAYGQGWLPDSMGSLANSTGSWALVAFLLALLGTSRMTACSFGFVSLFMLLVGFVVANEVREFATGSGTWLFWGTAALLAGPVLGLSAYWVRFERDELAAIGVGSMSGVLVGEGIYGLRYISETTYPPYWWGQMAVGVVLLVTVIAIRLHRPRAVLIAVAVTAAVALLFVVVYSRAPDIFTLIP